jgi:hypothetical protein
MPFTSLFETFIDLESFWSTFSSLDVLIIRIKAYKNNISRYHSNGFYYYFFAMPLQKVLVLFSCKTSFTNIFLFLLSSITFPLLFINIITLLRILPYLTASSAMLLVFSRDFLIVDIIFFIFPIFWIIYLVSMFIHI